MSQIFQNVVPKSDFFDFLKMYCDANSNQYIFSKEAFKRAKMNNSVEPFCENLKKYYFPSKYHYLEREKIFKHFVTIVRLICKYHHIQFTSKIKYSKSKYEITYFIYHDLGLNT